MPRHHAPPRRRLRRGVRMRHHRTAQERGMKAEWEANADAAAARGAARASAAPRTDGRLGDVQFQGACCRPCRARAAEATRGLHKRQPADGRRLAAHVSVRGMPKESRQVVPRIRDSRMIPKLYPRQTISGCCRARDATSPLASQASETSRSEEPRPESRLPSCPASRRGLARRHACGGTSSPD